MIMEVFYFPEERYKFGILLSWTLLQSDEDFHPRMLA